MGDEVSPRPPAGSFALDKQSAEEMKAQTAKSRTALVRKQLDLQQEVEREREEIKRERDALEARLRERTAALEKRLAPLRAELARLEEMSWTVDLYLGRHETVELIKDGAPAPADTPLTLRQMVLAADEESLILGEEAKFDHRHMETFIEWLCKSDKNRDRIIPDQRGVVVVVPTRQKRNYGNVFENSSRQEQNERAHWILRNGERLYLMVTDPELAVGPRILPRRDEFVQYFYSRFTNEPLEPGSAKWVDAEERADAHHRHYMRLMLVLQGIVDRSVAFHPLPEGGINLMSITSQDRGTVVLMNEEDRALTDGRPSFREWQASLNALLRPGLRVVLGRGIDEYDDKQTYTGNDRITPPKASHPPIDEPLMVESKHGDGFVLRYARRDEVERTVRRPSSRPGYEYVSREWSVPTRRASCVVYARDTWVLPFDLASVEDLNYYLNSREARTTYQESVPVIHAALRAKAQEFEEEAPLRRLLASTIAQEAGETSDEDLDRELDDVVRWWKTGNKYARALSADAKMEAKAAPAIVAEWRNRRKHRPDPRAAETVLAASRAMKDVLVVAYTRSKKYIAVSASGKNHGPWLTITTMNSRGEVVEVDEWTSVASRTLSTMHVIWEAPAWKTWDKYPKFDKYLSGPERDVLCSKARDLLVERGAEPIMVTERLNSHAYSEPDRMFVGIGWKAGADPTDSAAYSGPRAEAWSNRNAGMDAFCEFVVLRWTRAPEGVTVRELNRGATWNRYSAGIGPGIPFDDDVSERDRASGCFELVWKGEEFDRAMTLSSAHHEKSEAERRARHDQDLRLGGIAVKWIERCRDGYRKDLEKQAREDFLVDFGTDAAADPALWEHHLGTLNLDRKVPRIPEWLDRMMRRLIRASIDPSGKTLAELAQIDRGLVTEESQSPTADAMGEWATVVVSAKAAD